MRPTSSSSTNFIALLNSDSEPLKRKNYFLGLLFFIITNYIIILNVIIVTIKQGSAPLIKSPSHMNCSLRTLKDSWWRLDLGDSRSQNAVHRSEMHWRRKVRGSCFTTTIRRPISLTRSRLCLPQTSDTAKVLGSHADIDLSFKALASLRQVTFHPWCTSVAHA